MPILILSLILSVLIGCVVWLVLGEMFPIADEPKLPPLNNIVIYSLLSFFPVYLSIFFVIG